jgi:hypothetical protein
MEPAGSIGSGVLTYGFVRCTTPAEFQNRTRPLRFLRMGGFSLPPARLITGDTDE